MTSIGAAEWASFLRKRWTLTIGKRLKRHTHTRSMFRSLMPPWRVRRWKRPASFVIPWCITPVVPILTSRSNETPSTARGETCRKGNYSRSMENLLRDLRAQSFSRGIAFCGQSMAYCKGALSKRPNSVSKFRQPKSRSTTSVTVFPFAMSPPSTITTANRADFVGMNKFVGFIIHVSPPRDKTQQSRAKARVRPKKYGPFSRPLTVCHSRLGAVMGIVLARHKARCDCTAGKSSPSRCR